jgi:TPR repeat protein
LRFIKTKWYSLDLTGIIGSLAIAFALLTHASGSAQAPAAEKSGPTPKQAQAACERGNMSACLTVGRMLQTGDGVAVDPVSAYKLFKMVCNAGDARGCVAQAKSMNTGTGVVQDELAATSLLEKTCDAGSPQACAYAGRQYADGIVPSSNPAMTAYLLFEQACKPDFPEGCTLRDKMADIIANMGPPKTGQSPP